MCMELNSISNDETPFGKSYDDWISEYWNWLISLPTDESTSKPGGCLMHESGSMVMLSGPNGGLTGTTTRRVRFHLSKGL